MRWGTGLEAQIRHVFRKLKKRRKKLEKGRIHIQLTSGRNSRFSHFTFDDQDQDQKALDPERLIERTVQDKELQ